MLKVIEQVRCYLLAAEKTVAVASLVALLGLSLVQIFARNFFDSGFNHLDIITRHLVLCVAFMGAALACETDGNIKIDILANLLPQPYREKLVRPLLIMGVIIMGVFAWHSIRFWMDEWSYAGDAERMEVMFALVVPAGFCVLALHLALLLLANKERVNK